MTRKKQPVGGAADDVFDTLQAALDAAKAQADDAAAHFAAWLRALADRVEHPRMLAVGLAGHEDNTRALALKADCEECLAAADPRPAKGVGAAPAAMGPGLKMLLQLALSFLSEWLANKQQQPAG
jgi:hypothetical protein